MGVFISDIQDIQFYQISTIRSMAKLRYKGDIKLFYGNHNNLLSIWGCENNSIFVRLGFNYLLKDCESYLKKIGCQEELTCYDFISDSGSSKPTIEYFCIGQVKNEVPVDNIKISYHAIVETNERLLQASKNAGITITSQLLEAHNLYRREPTEEEREQYVRL